MASDLDNLRALLAEHAPTQADLADERDEEDRRQALRERVCTIGELVWKETDQAQPLLGPLVRRGMTTVLGGYGGAGKSTMGIEMIEAIVTADEFLGYDGAGGKAFIVDLEQGLSVAQRRVYESFVGRRLSPGINLRDEIERIKMTGNAWNDVLYADWQEGVDLSNPGPALDVMREMLDKHQPDVVMIDPVYKLFMGTDLNEQVGISAFVQQIQRLRTEYGFALILPMHPRKPGIQPTALTMHSLYGSAVWSWWAETILMIQRKDDASTLRFEKDRIGDGPQIGSSWNLSFERGRGFQRADTDATSADNTARRRIWTWLQRPEIAGEFWSRNQIAEALNINLETAGSALRQMRKDSQMNEYPGLEFKQYGPGYQYAYRPEKNRLVEVEQVAPDEDEDWSYD